MPDPAARVTVLLALQPKEYGPILAAEDLARLESAARVVRGEGLSGKMPPGDFVARLAELRPDVLVTSWGSPRLTLEAFRAAGKLRLLVHCAGTVRSLVDPACLQAGLTVTNWGTTISRSVAEGALLLTLAALRRQTAVTLHLHVRREYYGLGERMAGLFEKTVGLYGYGAIAQEYRRLIAPFGVQVLAYDPYAPDHVLARDAVTRVGSLDELFERSEVVSIHAGRTDSTIGSVNARVLSRLRDGGVLVNTARGALVDSDALAAELASGRIAAGLDVFDPHEPLPADSPLRGLENVVLTPHSAGPTPDRKKDMGRTAVDNVLRFIRGEPLQFVVTADQLDRMT